MNHLLLENPGLECTACFRFYRDDRVLPLCYSPQGCSIEDLASDEELTENAHQFLSAKALYSATMDPRVQADVFEKLGLYEDTESHIELEGIYSKWLTIQRAHKRS